MMKSLALLVLLFLSPLAAAEESWPLKFSAGPEWDIQSQGDGIDFFSFTRPKGENILFTTLQVADQRRAGADPSLYEKDCGQLL
jgi:hypothetical protein